MPAGPNGARWKPTWPPAHRAPSPPPYTNNSALTAGTATPQAGANEKPLQLAHRHSERSALFALRMFFRSEEFLFRFFASYLEGLRLLSYAVCFNGRSTSVRQLSACSRTTSS